MREAVTVRLEEYRRQLAKFPAQQAAVSEAFLESNGTFDEAQLLYLHVYAPVITAYVEWVLDEAVRAGKKRLYFLARDAYPMYETAKHLCAVRGLEMDCRYLKVSRYCVRLPEYWLLKERSIDRICVGGLTVTLGTILRRAGLTKQESEEISALLECESTRVLSYREIVGLKEKLLRIPLFLQYTYMHSQAAYADTIGYLAQEGLFDEIPYALVDSGWIGTIQQSIQNLLRTRQRTRVVEGYYFGLYELPRGEKADTYHAFYFAPRSGMRRKIYFSNCLFEAIYSGGESMTTGYRRENGQFTPIQEGRGNPNAAFLYKNEKALLLYLKVYLRTVGGQGKHGGQWGSLLKGNGSSICEGLLKRAMARPEKWEVEAYGDSLFSDDMLEGTMQTVAAQFEKSDIKKQRLTYRIPVMLGLRKGHIKESAWIEGSLVRCGENEKAALRRTAAYKRVIYLKKALQRKRK